MVLALKKQYSDILEPYLQIQGGVPLKGMVSLPGAKNSALPSIVAACLSEEEVTLHNVPVDLNDVKQLVRLLREAGADIRMEGSTLHCSGKNWKGGTLNAELAGKIRHSLLLLGLSAKWSKSLFLPLPGGCSIGNRKHDLHLFALQELGYAMEESDLGLHLKESEPDQEVELRFHYPTFGGTLNVLFAAVSSHSVVTLRNAARNPEIVDVISLLTGMGADIVWADESSLRIRGVGKLHAAEHTVMSDRIIASTIIAAVGVTKGSAVIGNASVSVLNAEVAAWRRAGLMIADGPGGIHVEWAGTLQTVDVETAAYPAFHTDIQPLHTALMATARGRSVLKETILDGRFAYCDELNKMGAKISVVEGDFKCVNGAQGQLAIIDGQNKLYGADVIATDIRGGAAVAVAALGAEGQTRITNLYQLERGYGNFVELFTALGAQIERITP
ncbi:UDP-N-acetylglucosamine 1-carboxyvinyltransferase [Paenibacillus sp. GCM10012307]|uniref:UDP-N-acetylglucosamine 1-carboxyvinyltransferase n=1 Tax=Paenibacillus roseus TaxID=2798579 RepID=A0A934IY19_9BACL|nr:UDP-N-acetylglucosamine 1-carboxyvinyltransferase [Paenibacillus roseus]MBJ6359789.1 UDP-N-acetylglucosamine 1-carboxyvinyltransferase [Paenibacillus roseus]